jgi:hypothetical protein
MVSMGESSRSLKLLVGATLTPFIYIVLSTILSTTPLGQNRLFDPIRNEMKFTLMGEYAFQLPRLTVDEDTNDRIIRAIKGYNGPVNYSKFREHLRQLDLEEDYLSVF